MAQNGRLTSAVDCVVAFYDHPLGQFSCLLCWTPPEKNAETCITQSPHGKICTREPKHDGPHAACGPRLVDHPFELWED